ncbi:unnamed protein product [Trifolium pratense]|uniref:Uncharacterized protein n=1 Tax=Trifolium pratense TaxID=57577 RepID=A0ACB0IAE0_TRIPR|nr:unnamed protein product [Trifolium pratense]
MLLLKNGVGMKEVKMMLKRRSHRLSKTHYHSFRLRMSCRRYHCTLSPQCPPRPTGNRCFGGSLSDL